MFRCLILIACAATLCSAQRQCQSTGSDGDVGSPMVFSAPSVVSTVTDPVGDTFSNHDASFQDIVGGQMTRTAAGDFEFVMEMAGAVPDAPSLAKGHTKEIWWIWIFELDANNMPQGYPWNAAGGMPPEFMVYVSWDGVEFSGTAIDRRPLLTGGDAIITPVPFSINGKFVEAFLDSELIGDVPDSFQWGPFTMSWSGSIGSEGRHFADYFQPLAVFNP